MSTDKTRAALPGDNMLKMLSNEDVAPYQGNGKAK
jgi:hypothetical protein